MGIFVNMISIRNFKLRFDVEYSFQFLDGSKEVFDQDGFKAGFEHNEVLVRDNKLKIIDVSIAVKL